MPVIMRNKLPPDHPFYNGAVIFVKRPQKNSKENSKNPESNSQKQIEFQKQIDKEAREQFSGSPTGEEPKGSKS